MIEVTECRICSSDKLHPFLSLGPMPLANSFLMKEQLSQEEKFYPLDVLFCTSCGLVQLGQVVPPETMFCEYAYLTGTSYPLRSHFASLVKEVVLRTRPSRGSLVIDIGSNDGTLLEEFKKCGMAVLGIEPARNVASLAVDRGIDTLSSWFTESLAEEIKSKRGTPSIITATNVFAHVHHIKDFVRGVRLLMDEETVFVVEVPYLLDILSKVEFDTIYHEHLSYFSVCALDTLFTSFDMRIVDVERISNHGGSLRLYIKKGLKRSPQSLVDLRGLEITSGLLTLKPYESFSSKVTSVKERLITLLSELKSGGYSISGYGAPAKSTTLLNFCRIGIETLDYLSDTTPTKQGRYSPGMHISICPESHFRLLPPDFSLLLAWNYTSDILRREAAYLGCGGKFILPIPEPQIVGEK